MLKEAVHQEQVASVPLVPTAAWRRAKGFSWIKERTSRGFALVLLLMAARRNHVSNSEIRIEIIRKWGLCCRSLRLDIGTLELRRW